MLARRVTQSIGAGQERNGELSYPPTFEEFADELSAEEFEDGLCDRWAASSTAADAMLTTIIANIQDAITMSVRPRWIRIVIICSPISSQGRSFECHIQPQPQPQTQSFA